jgi:hypothetical protein
VLTSANSRSLAARSVELDAIELAVRAFVGKAGFFQLDDMGVINLDPAQRFRQVHAVRPRIEAGAEIEDSVDALGDGFMNESVDDDRADHDRPGADKASRNRGQDIAAVVAGELGGERIAEQRVRPLRFERAEAGHHEGGVRDVADDLSHEDRVLWFQGLAVLDGPGAVRNATQFPGFLRGYQSRLLAKA